MRLALIGKDNINAVASGLNIAAHDTITLTQSGANSVISFSSGGSVTLLGVQTSQLAQTSTGYTWAGALHV